jgi:hypothetical protein
VVLADPEGNEFCVIEPGDSFLAGCGFLGELACDGSQAVGHFWSQALGRPQVHPNPADARERSLRARGRASCRPSYPGRSGARAPRRSRSR